MSYKKQLSIIFFISLILFGIGVFLAEADFFGLCGEYQYSCLSDTERIGQPVGIFALAMIPVLITLFFLKEQVYYAWGKFSLWFLPLSAILTILSSNSGEGVVFGSSALLDQEGVTMLLAGIFFAVSLGIIAYKSLKLRRRE